MNLVVISSKRYHSDFRKYLVQAASSAGQAAYHVHCWSALNVTRNDVESPDATLNLRDSHLLEMSSRLQEGRDTVVLTGMTAFRSRFGRSLKKLLPHAIFVYDVYDDFRYDTKGFKLLRRLQRDWTWRMHCDLHMVLEQGLLQRYPKAFHLDNASHLGRLTRDDGADWIERAVYIGSIDQRTDFAWLERVAQSGIGIDLWGRAHGTLAGGQEVIDRFCARHPQVCHKGGYDNDDLPGILSQYRVGLLPYVTDSDWTRHINPDKLYHYLNSGLEVVATDIPQSRRLSSFLHVVSASGDPAAAVRTALRSNKASAWSVEAHQWAFRWQQLQECVSAQTRGAR